MRHRPPRGPVFAKVSHKRAVHPSIAYPRPDICEALAPRGQLRRSQSGRSLAICGPRRYHKIDILADLPA